MNQKIIIFIQNQRFSFFLAFLIETVIERKKGKVS